MTYELPFGQQQGLLSLTNPTAFKVDAIYEALCKQHGWGDEPALQVIIALAEGGYFNPRGNW